MAFGFIAALIAIATSAGVYYQQKKMEAQAKKQANEAKAVQISGHDSNRGLYTVYGKALVGSTVVWKKVSDKQARITQTGFTTFSAATGTDLTANKDWDHNRWLYRAVTLCNGPVESVTNVTVDDESYESPRFTNGADFHFATSVSLGPTAGQNFSALRNAYASDFATWDSNAVGKGVCYAMERMYLSKNYTAFQGEPQTRYLVKGRKVYDPRKDSTSSAYDSSLGVSSHRADTASTWQWSDNPVICLLDYLRNEEYGRGLPLSVIDVASIATAADKCDVLVDVPAVLTNDTGSNVTQYDPETGITYITTPLGTFPYYRPDQETTGANANKQKRFRLNIAVDPAKEILENIQEILNVFRGNLSYANGKYMVHMADVQNPVLTLGDDDIIGGLKVANGDRSQRMNRATVKFINQNKQHKTDQISWPSIDSNRDGDLYATYLSQDEDEKLHRTFTVKGCTDFYQAQDTAEFLVRDSRSNLTVTGTFGSRCFGLVPGDVISLTYDSAGFSGKYFRVMQANIDLVSMNVQLQLKEYDSSVYTWNSTRGNEPLGLSWQEEVVNAPPTTPTIGTIATNTRTRADGSTAITLTIPFTGVPEEAQYLEVSWAVNGTNDYNTQLVFDTENQTQTEVAVERDGETYAIRIRYFATNSYGTLMPSTYATTTHAVADLSGTKLDGIEDGATQNTGALADLDTVDTAQIADEAVTIAKIDTALESTNYSAGTSGWKLTKAGVFEAGDGTFRGALTATSGSIDSSVTIGGTTASTLVSDSEEGKQVSDQTSLLPRADDSEWVVGDYTSKMGIWVENGLDENEVVLAEGPHGDIVKVWKATSTDGSNADGGFYNGVSDAFPIEADTVYRLSVFIKQTNTNGSFYFGAYNYSSSGSNINLYKYDGTGGTTNKYWKSGDLPTQGDWYLLVGFINPSDTNISGGKGGLYKVSTGEKVQNYDDWRFSGAGSETDATKFIFRTYQYYADTTPTAIMEWAHPRVDRMDRRAPSIPELLRGWTGLSEPIEQGVTITGGGITMSSGGSIKGGQTAFNTGTGFFLGYSTVDSVDDYRLSIGDSTNSLVWDGSDLTVTGGITADSFELASGVTSITDPNDLVKNTNNSAFFRYETTAANDDVSALSDSDFNTAFGRNPRNRDVLIVVNTASDPDVSAAYVYDSSLSTPAFAAKNDFLTGDLIVDGTVKAANIDVNDLITTGSLLTGSATISNDIRIGSGDSVFSADSAGIYLGSETFSSAEFSVTPTGVMTATGATITGGSVSNTTTIGGGTTKAVQVSNAASGQYFGKDLAYYWPCNEIISGKIPELIAGKDGVISGSNYASDIDSPTGKAYKQTGTSVGATLLNNTDSNALETSAGFAWSFWFRSDTSSGVNDARIISNDLSDGYGLLIDQSGSSQGLTFYGEPSSESVGTVAEGEWHHFVFSSGAFTSGSSTISIYLDGALVGTESYTPVASSRPVVIGCNTESTIDTASDVFIGAITEIRAYSRTLTADDVQALYENPNGAIDQTVNKTGGTVGGVTITSSSLYHHSGATTPAFGNENTSFYLDSSGNFSLKDKLQFDGSTLTVDGAVEAQTFSVLSSDPNDQTNVIASDVKGGSVSADAFDNSVWSAIDLRILNASGAQADTNVPAVDEEASLTGIGSPSAESGPFFVTISGAQTHSGRDIQIAGSINFAWSTTSNFTNPSFSLQVQRADNSAFTTNLTDVGSAVTVTATKYLAYTVYVYTAEGAVSFSTNPSNADYYWRLKITASSGVSVGPGSLITDNTAAFSIYESGGTTGNSTNTGSVGGLSIGGDTSIAGNLTVTGSTTTLTTQDLQVNDQTIVLNYLDGDSSSTADGSGIVIQDAIDSSNDSSILWSTANDHFAFSHKITAPTQSVFGSGATGTPNSNAQIIAEADSVGGVAIHVNDGGSSYIWFGDNTDNAVGRIRYDHSDDKFKLRAGAVNDVFTLDSSGNATISGDLTASGNISYVPENINNSGTDMTGLSDGWYRWASTPPTDGPFNYAVMVQLSDPNQKIQMAFGSSSNGQLAIRRADSGTFYSWTKFWSDADFSSTQISNWDTAYTYSQVGHLPLAGGTLTGSLTGTSATFNGNVSAQNLTLLASSGHTTFTLGSRSADPTPTDNGSYDFKPGMRVSAFEPSDGTVDGDADLPFVWIDTNPSTTSEGYLAANETYATATFSKTFTVNNANGTRWFAKLKTNDAETGNDPRFAVNGGTEYELTYTDAAPSDGENDTDGWHVIDITDDVVTGSNTLKVWLEGGQKTYILAVYVFPSTGIMLPNEPYESVGYFHKGIGVGDTRIVNSSRDLINIGDITLAEKIIHDGDSDTFIQFEADSIDFETGGSSRFKIDNNDVSVKDADLQFNNGVFGLKYLPQESTAYNNPRFFLIFDYTDDASFPYLTNRTPNGKVEIHSGSSASGGSETVRMRFVGGSGTQDIDILNADLDLNDNDIKQVKTITVDGAQSGNTLPLVDAKGHANQQWAGRFENYDSAGYGILGITASNSSNQSAFEIRKNTNNQAMLIKADGTTFLNYATTINANVAINGGNTVPLDVTGTASSGLSYGQFVNDATASTSNKVGLEFRLNTSAQERQATLLQSEFTNITDASRQSRFRIYTQNAGTQVSFDFHGDDLTVPGTISADRVEADGIAEAGDFLKSESDEPTEVQANAALGGYACFVGSGSTYVAVLEPDTVIYEFDPATGNEKVFAVRSPDDTAGVTTVTDRIYRTKGQPFTMKTNGRHDYLAPLAFSGHLFGFYSNRYSPQKVNFYAPAGGARVNVYQDSGTNGTIDYTFDIQPNQFKTYTGPSATGYFVFEVVGSPLVATLTGSGGGDHDVLRPASRFRYYGDQTNGLQTTKEIYTHSNATIAASNSVTYSYTSPVYGNKIGDGAGGDTLTGVPLQMLADNYLIGHAMSGIMFTAPYPDTEIKVYEHNGTSWSLVDSYSLNGSLTSPAATYDGTNIDGGGTGYTASGRSVLVCGNKPFLVSTNDAGDDEYEAEGWLSKYHNALPKQSSVFAGYDGTTSLPNFTFADDTNTGMWRSAADTLNFSTGGTERLELGTNRALFAGNVQVGSDQSSYNSYGRLQVNQAADNDESGIGILSSGAGRSMRLWTDSTKSYINSGDGGGADLVFNEAVTVSSGGDLSGVDTLEIQGASTNTTFTSPGQLAIKRSNGNPFISFHDNDGVRNGYIQGLSTQMRYASERSGGWDWHNGSAQRMILSNAGALTVVGSIDADSYIEAGEASGGVALTINDGGGNANLAFNHNHEYTRVAGSWTRIKTDVDGTTAAFEVYIHDNVSANTEYSYNAGLLAIDAKTSRIQFMNNEAEISSTGNAIFEGNVTAYGTASDIRLKSDIEVIPEALSKVQKLRGVRFTYDKDGSRSTGLIAQEVMEVLPEVVYETHEINEDEPFYALRYGNTVGLLVEAIKEQQEIIEDMKKRIEDLENGDDAD